MAAAATAAVAVGAALAAGVGNALNSADDMGKMAQKVGVGVESLSALRYAADLSDVSLDQLGTGLKRLGANMASAAGGAKGPAADAFKALGLSATDAAGNLKAPDAMFKEIAGKFAGMEDGAGKTALAMAIFGKSGADLIPMLNSGSTGLAAMADEARALGIVITDQTAKAAEQFNDNVTRLKTATGGIAVQLAAGLAPALATVSGFFVDAAKNTHLMDAVSRVLSNTFKGLVTGVVILGVAFKTAFLNVAAVAQSFAQIVTGNFVGAWRTISGAATRTVADYRGAAGAIQKIWSDAGAAVEGRAPALGGQLAAPIIQGAARARKAVEEWRASFRLLEGHPDKISLDTTTADGQGGKLRLRIIPEVTPADWGPAVQALSDQMKSDQSVRAQLAEDIRFAFADGVVAAFDGNLGGFLKGFFRQMIGDSVMSLTKGLGNSLAGALKGSTGLLGSIGKNLPVIGGIVGIAGSLLGSIFGGGKKKKEAAAAAAQAKADEAARVAAEAAAHATEIANQKRALEIELMELSGDAAAALAARRADELAALDDSLDALQEQVWAQEDANKATEAAREIADRAAEAAREAAQADADLLERFADMQRQHADKRVELLEAQGRAEEAVALARELQLAATPQYLKAIQAEIFAAEDAAAATQKLADAQKVLDDQLKEDIANAEGRVADARNELSAAYEREASALKETKTEFQGFADSIGEALAGLTKGAAGAALADFNRIGALARLGNRDALGQIGGLAPGAADAVRAGASTAVDAARGIAGIRNVLTEAQTTALRQVSVADMQIARLDASVEGLLNINESVLSVNEAINGLAAAELALLNTLAADTVTNAEQIAGMREEMRIGLATLARNTGKTVTILDGATQPDGLQLNTVAA